jgi:hypothetical protein
MFCYHADGYGHPCIYCGLPLEPHSIEQMAIIERERHRSWWRRPDDERGSDAEK